MPKDSEASVFVRPACAEIHGAWFTLFSDPMLSLANLKAVAAAGLGAPDEEGGILLRSVYWRFYFGLLPPPTSLDLFPPALAASRKAYNDLRARFLVAPDGRWAADCSGGEGYAPATSNGIEWDPLSLDGSSPWKTWFAHLELREMIRQDVERTFPDIPYFTIERVRKSLTTMLFIFSVLNPDVGYRQGMHELLAVCLMVVDRDSLDASSTPGPSPVASSPFSPLQRSGAVPSGIPEAMNATLDRTYIEHDAFDLFQELMRPAKSLYEWRTEEATVRLPGGPQAPILEKCNHIQSQLIRKIDPQLWERLEQEGVEAQIWAIRWVRLILTRELPFAMALRLWDGIFAADPNLGILDFVCIAMLLLIRNELIEADYPTILTHLLHYPAPSDTYPFNPSLILAQANFLRHDISPTAGVEVVLQNQELLGVKATDRSKINLDIDSPTAWRPGGGMTPPPRTNSARDRARAGVSGLAAGLFERAQKAGLDRAFLSTVSDFRNNLPDAATAYSFLPRFSPGPQQESFSPSPSPSNPFTSAGLPNRPLPPALNHLPSSESNMSIKSMLDAERQMAEMRLAMVTMGKAMSQWMDTISEDKTNAQSESVAEAWAGLNRVRDSLLDAAGQDVDELVKDWAWNHDLDSSRSQASSIAPTPVYEAPPPVPQIPTKTPTRAAFDDPDAAAVVHETPKQQSRARMEPPPPIPILSVATTVPAAPATARPPGTSPSVNLNTSPVAPTSAPTIISTHTSAHLLSATALAQAISDNGDGKTKGSTPAGSPVRLITPPPRNASFRASMMLKPSTDTSTNTSTPITPASASGASGTSGAPTPDPLSPPGSADPLAGLDVGSIPRSATSRQSGSFGHERRRSAWRVSAAMSPTSLSSLSGSGSGSGSGSEAVGMDPLGGHLIGI